MLMLLPVKHKQAFRPQLLETPGMQLHVTLLWGTSGLYD